MYACITILLTYLYKELCKTLIYRPLSNSYMPVCMYNYITNLFMAIPFQHFILKRVKGMKTTVLQKWHKTFLFKNLYNLHCYSFCLSALIRSLFIFFLSFFLSYVFQYLFLMYLSFFYHLSFS